MSYLILRDEEEQYQRGFFNACDYLKEVAVTGKVKRVSQDRIVRDVVNEILSLHEQLQELREELDRVYPST